MIRKLLCTAALLAWGLVTAHASPVLSVTPSLSNVTVGDTFTLDISVSGVTDLFSWQLDVDFGPAGLLNASAPAVGGFLGGGQTFGYVALDNGTGTITGLFSALSGSSGVSGSGVLASIMFDAMFSGTATISLLNLELGDSNLDIIFTSDPVSATVNISDRNPQVPEPSTLALLGIALAFTTYPRRRGAKRVA